MKWIVAACLFCFGFWFVPAPVANYAEGCRGPMTRREWRLGIRTPRGDRLYDRYVIAPIRNTRDGCLYPLGCFQVGIQHRRVGNSAEIVDHLSPALQPGYHYILPPVPMLPPPPSMPAVPLPAVPLPEPIQTPPPLDEGT